MGESTKKAAPAHFAIHKPSQYYIGIGQSILNHIAAVVQSEKNRVAADAAKAAKAARKSDADQRAAAEWTAAEVEHPLEEEYISLTENCL